MGPLCWFKRDCVDLRHSVTQNPGPTKRKLKHETSQCFGWNYGTFSGAGGEVLCENWGIWHSQQPTNMKDTQTMMVIVDIQICPLSMYHNAKQLGVICMACHHYIHTMRVWCAVLRVFRWWRGDFLIRPIWDVNRGLIRKH